MPKKRASVLTAKHRRELSAYVTQTSGAIAALRTVAERLHREIYLTIERAVRVMDDPARRVAGSYNTPHRLTLPIAPSHPQSSTFGQFTLRSPADAARFTREITALYESVGFKVGAQRMPDGVTIEFTIELPRVN